MSGASIFAGLDGLMSLSRREGIDVRPTLLRVLTDLYVQKARHTSDEENQYIELATRLFDQVDDATRAVVRAKLAKYPAIPAPVATLLALPKPSPVLEEPADEPAPGPVPSDANPATGIGEAFFAGSTEERLAILQQVELAPLRLSNQPNMFRAARAVLALEAAALRADAESFAAEVAASLSLPPIMAARIVADRDGEALACAMRALDMPANVFQRVLMFLDPIRGRSVKRVYRLARFYEVLGADAALSMIAAWRGPKFVAPQRAKHQSALYDDERHRARAAAPGERPAVRAGDAFRRAARAAVRQ